MYINVNDPESYKYIVIDLISGKAIPGVQDANDETGEFSIVMRDLVNDKWIVDQDNNLVNFNFKGTIKIVKNAN